MIVIKARFLDMIAIVIFGVDLVSASNYHLDFNYSPILFLFILFTLLIIGVNLAIMKFEIVFSLNPILIHSCLALIIQSSTNTLFLIFTISHYNLFKIGGV